MSVVPLVSPCEASQEGPARRLVGEAFTRVFRPAARTVMRIACEIRTRRDMRRLAEFDDHMLRDIGIARADIEGAVRRGRDDRSGSAGCASLSPSSPLLSPSTRIGWR